jgi:Flp pilus assembly protein TadD
MKLIASLLLLFSMALLSAQTGASDLQSLRIAVAQNPVDATARINLAYQLMLTGNNSEALSHYETLLIQNNRNIPAMEGVLWALQTQGLYQESVDRAKAFLALSPATGSLHSYKAYGLSRLGLHLAARSAYSKAKRLSDDDSVQQSTKLGLAWEYLYLQDYASAKTQLSKLESRTDPHAGELLHDTELKIAVGAGTNYADLTSGNLNLAIRKAAFSAEANYDELMLDGARFRRSFGISAMWQNPVANLKVDSSILLGKDKRVYPANSYGMSLQPVFYLDKLQVKPSLSGHYGTYQRLDAQQADLGFELRSDRLSGSYSFSLLYLDKDSIDSDEREQVHSFSLGVKAYKQAWLKAYLMSGNTAWWTSPYGLVYDAFEANSSIYGLSLYSPIGKKMGFLLYSQIGTQNNETDISTALTLSYSI